MLKSFKKSDGSQDLLALDEDNRIGIIGIGIKDKISITQKTWIDTNMDSIFCCIFDREMLVSEYGELSIIRIQQDIKDFENDKMVQENVSGCQVEILKDFGSKIINILRLGEHLMVFLENGKFYEIKKELKSGNMEFLEHSTELKKVNSVSISQNQTILLISGNTENFIQSFKIKLFLVPKFVYDEDSNKLLDLVKDSLSLLKNSSGNVDDLILGLKKQGLFTILQKYLETILIKDNQKKLQAAREKIIETIQEALVVDRITSKLLIFGLYLNMIYKSDPKDLNIAQIKSLKSKMVKSFLNSRAQKEGGDEKKDLLMAWSNQYLQNLECSECGMKDIEGIDFTVLVARCACSGLIVVDPMTGMYGNNFKGDLFCKNCEIMQSQDRCFLCFQLNTRFDKLI